MEEQNDMKKQMVLYFIFAACMIILNYVILDRFHFFVNKFNEKEEKGIAKN